MGKPAGSYGKEPRYLSSKSTFYFFTLLFIESHLATSTGEAVLPLGTAAAAALPCVALWFWKVTGWEAGVNPAGKGRLKGFKPGRERLVSGKVTFIPSRHSPELWQGDRGQAWIGARAEFCIKGLFLKICF